MLIACFFAHFELSAAELVLAEALNFPQEPIGALAVGASLQLCPLYDTLSGSADSVSCDKLKNGS